MNKRPPHKTCSSCKTEKYFKDFSKNRARPDGYHNQCKECRSKSIPSEKAQTRQRDYLRHWNRFKISGFTKEDYEEKLKEQDGKCAICKTDDNGKQDWCADHNHETGQKRGLLCHKCNTGIGLLKDDPEILIAAIEYLNTYAGRKQ